VRAAEMLRAGTGANVSVSLADRFELEVGDRLDLDTPRGMLSLVIAGIVPDYMSDRGSVIFNRRLLVDHWGDQSVNRVHLFLEPRVSADVVRRTITDRLGQRYRLKVLEPEQVVAFHTAQVDRAFLLMDAIQLLIVVVTVAGVLDLLLSAILERRRELSLWRLIGAAERSVRRSVVVESATIGLLGSALGVALGVVTSWIWVRINFRYLLGYYLDYHFAAGSAAWLTTLVMFMTVLAGYGAAYRTTRRSVLEGLRIE
jgi:putative ABC transport system permease protein